jgi:hypothetical protein
MSLLDAKSKNAGDSILEKKYIAIGYRITKIKAVEIAVNTKLVEMTFLTFIKLSSDRYLATNMTTFDPLAPKFPILAAIVKDDTTDHKPNFSIPSICVTNLYKTNWHTLKITT